MVHQVLGDSETRIKMASCSTCGDKNQRLLRHRTKLAVSTDSGFSVFREILTKIPIMKSVTIIEEPPNDINGRVIPLVGKSPEATPMLITA